MFYLLGLAIFLVSVGATITILGGDLLFFLNFPAILAILIPLTGVLTATQSFRTFGLGFKAVIFPGKPISEELRGKAASLFRFLSKITALSSAIILLICLINLLMYWADNPEEIMNWGDNIAALVLSLLYGLTIIAAIFEPVVYILKKRQGKDK